MTVSREVQAQADKIRELSDIVQSVDQAMATLKTQLDSLKSQVAAVPVASAPTSSTPASPGLSQEDKDAITTSISDTQKLIDRLKSDIVAGTPQEAGASQGSSPVQPVAPNTDPSTVQPPASTSAPVNAATDTSASPPAAPATPAPDLNPPPANPGATTGTPTV